MVHDTLFIDLDGDGTWCGSHDDLFSPIIDGYNYDIFTEVEDIMDQQSPHCDDDEDCSLAQDGYVLYFKVPGVQDAAAYLSKLPQDADYSGVVVRMDVDVDAPHIDHDARTVIFDATILLAPVGREQLTYAS